jgi:hypothetical protein
VADQELRERVAWAIGEALTGALGAGVEVQLVWPEMAASHGEEGRPRANISTAALGEVAADAAIAACDAWDGEQRLAAHEHMVSNAKNAPLGWRQRLKNALGSLGRSFGPPETESRLAGPPRPSKSARQSAVQNGTLSRPVDKRL